MICGWNWLFCNFRIGGIIGIGQDVTRVGDGFMGLKLGIKKAHLR